MITGVAARAIAALCHRRKRRGAAYRANPVPQYPGFTRGPREQRRGSNAAMAASAASLVAVAGRPSHVSQAKLRSRPLSLVLNRAEDCRGPSAPRALPAEPLVAAAQMLSVNCVGDVSALDAGAAAAIQAFFRPVVSVYSLFFIARIVMTWYPEIDGTKAPWSLAYNPTEFILKPTRAVVPPLAGVDISPIVWVGLLSFINETVLGPQGILSIIQREGGL